MDRRGGGLTRLPAEERDSRSSSQTQPQPPTAPRAVSQQNRILSGMEGLAADCVLLIMFK